MATSFDTVERRSPKVQIGGADLPALYQAGDALSAAAQRQYRAIHGGLILVLILGAVVAAAGSALDSVAQTCPPNQTSVHPWQQLLGGITAVVLVCSLWLTKELQGTGKADEWYDGRALAESTKSIAWKYMMRAPPYGQDATRDVDKLFCEDALKLIQDTKSRLFLGTHADAPQISQAMRAVRTLDVAGRLEVYRESRIKDQREWYTKRGLDHKTSSRFWFRVIIVANVIAVAVAVLGVVWFPASVMLGVATTAASGGLAWMQLHRYSELAHSYSFTAHEIGLLTSSSVSIVSDEELARFVADCETAFSREHTMWRARREVA